VQHAQRRLLTALPRSKVGFPIACKERMRVRVYEARYDNAIAEFVKVGAAVPLRQLAYASGPRDAFAFNSDRAVVDAP
jgi:hypothetical protein